MSEKRHHHPGCPFDGMTETEQRDYFRDTVKRLMRDLPRAAEFGKVPYGVWVAGMTGTLMTALASNPHYQVPVLNALLTVCAASSAGADSETLVALIASSLESWAKESSGHANGKGE